MGQVVLQSSFQFGEVSPLLNAQISSPIYYKSARRLRNVLVLPQGGVKKRFGLEFIYDLGTALDYTEIKTKWFEHSDGKLYFLVFQALTIKIFYEGALVATKVSTYTGSEVGQLSLAQTGDYMVIAEGNHSPAILSRTAHPVSWNLDPTPTFQNSPTYDFLRNYSAYYFWVGLNDANIPAILTETSNVTGETVYLYTYSVGSYPPAPGNRVNYFQSNGIGGLFFGFGGVLKIESLGSNECAVCKIITPFTINIRTFSVKDGGNRINSIPGTEAVYTQPAFSDTYGWPKKVGFFQNRIWFGNTSSLPAGLWGSSFNGFSSTTFNFDESETLDTNAVSTILTADDKPVIIRDIIAYKTLIILTNIGVFSTPLFTDQPVTPSNVAFVNRQTSDASNNVPAVVLDNEVIFAIRGGNRIKNITVSSQGYNYQTNTISTLAPHLIDQPVSMDTYENSSIDDGNWLFLVNSGTNFPGTLAIYQSVPEQEITAWTLSTTKSGDYFREVASHDDTVYFLVERTYNGATHMHMESLNFSMYTDNTYTFTSVSPTTAITGATNLAGETVWLIVDGIFVGDVTVNASGAATSPVEGETFELGLEFNPLVRPMPLNIPTRIGSSLYLPKTINIVYVDYYESSCIEVNGNLIPPFTSGTSNFDEAPPLVTGFSKVEPFNGWDPRQNIDITQSVPLPFTIIGIGYVAST